MTTEITTTQSGTMIVVGVEYNTYPPPGTLVKVMERRWADSLVANGSMRFGSLASYREWENTVLGDPNDGEGMFRMRGHTYDTGSSNPVYAWCTSLPTITPDRILIFAEHGNYNCIVRVHDPLTLIRRVHAALVKSKRTLHLHCGEVSYDRGSEVDKDTLNSQKFHFNVFQKDPSFSEDMEYRFSLTDAHVRAEFKRHIDLQIGDCSDIMVIEELPNMGVKGRQKKLRRPRRQPLCKLDIDSNQQKNIEQAIDDLCENLVWAWAYFRALKGLHVVATSSPDSLKLYTQLTSCLYNGLFDVLFIKINNFIDASKGACGFPNLFRLLRKYISDDTDFLKQINSDENRLKNEADIKTVKSWRNGISAHLTQSYRNPSFFSSNRLHLNDLEILLELIAELLEKYSFQLLGRFNDTKHPSAEIIDEIKVLFLSRSEQPN